MLVDSLAHWRRYSFGPAWERVMAWLETASRLPDLPNLPDRPDLADGAHKAGECDVNVASLTTRPAREGRYETHRRLCDVHVVLAGQEWFFTATAASLAPEGEFDVARDVGFHRLLPPAGTAGGAPAPCRETARLTLTPGLFVLVFPEEAHMPAMAVDDCPAPLRKCVAKMPPEALRLR